MCLGFTFFIFLRWATSCWRMHVILFAPSRQKCASYLILSNNPIHHHNAFPKLERLYSVLHS